MTSNLYYGVGLHPILLKFHLDSSMTRTYLATYPWRDHNCLPNIHQSRGPKHLYLQVMQTKL